MNGKKAKAIRRIIGTKKPMPVEHRYKKFVTPYGKVAYMAYNPWQNLKRKLYKAYK